MEYAFLTIRCGDGEVSGSGVSEGVSEALTFMEWCAMVVPTYPEGVAAKPWLQMCQHHHPVVRVARPLCRVVRDSERLKEHVARDCSGRFG